MRAIKAALDPARPPQPRRPVPHVIGNSGRGLLVESGMTQGTVDVRRADERFATKISWLDSKHSFSFGPHYDPHNTHHGLLLVNNDDTVDPGTGFETHPHRDMEIVTWVLRGSLVHQDSTGHSGVIYPGLAQRMSAGKGILHSEKNDSWRAAGRRSTAIRCTSCRCGSSRTRAVGLRAMSSSRSATSSCAARWCRSPQAWRSTTTPPRSGSAIVTPRFTPRGLSPASR